MAIIPITSKAKAANAIQKPGRCHGLGLCLAILSEFDGGAFWDEPSGGAEIGSVSVMARWDIKAIYYNMLEIACTHVSGLRARIRPAISDNRPIEYSLDIQTPKSMKSLHVSELK
jgi:hypothetical protein